MKLSRSGVPDEFLMIQQDKLEEYTAGGVKVSGNHKISMAGEGLMILLKAQCHVFK